MFDNLSICFFPDCVAAYGFGMVTVVLGATMIAINQRREVKKALDRRETIIKELQSK